MINVRIIRGGKITDKMAQSMWLRFGAATIILLAESVADLKKRRINLWFIAGGMVAGIVLLVLDFNQIWKSALAGLAIGITVLLLAKITDEGIGYGDGILIACIGLILGGRNTLTMILFGCLGCCVFSMILLAFGKAGKQTRLPFVPFLVPGMVTTLCLEIL